MENIYDMDLHGEVEPWRGLRIIRVPGGWIYYSEQEQPGGHWQVTGTFVPFDNGFQKVESND